MAGLSPEEVVELKHAMAGMAEVTHAFYQELRSQGFMQADAMRLTAAWLTAMTSAGAQGGQDA